MSQKKTPFVGIEREKLIIALQMSDIVGAINLAMRVRKLSITLDYTMGHSPQLFMQMPDGPKQRFMHLDPRKHCCYISAPRDRELFYAFSDIDTRLLKLGGRLSLTGDKPPQGPRRCLLQVYVEGADKLGLTLMSVKKGHRLIDTAFQLPDGTTP